MNKVLEWFGNLILKMSDPIEMTKEDVEDQLLDSAKFNRAMGYNDEID